jgi:hypothetical protein
MCPKDERAVQHGGGEGRTAPALTALGLGQTIFGLRLACEAARVRTFKARRNGEPLFCTAS